MKLTKAKRERLRGMFDGKCAYCGGGLGERWHVDHVEAVQRKLHRDHETGKISTTGEVWRPEFDTFENLMPACAPCNIDKHTFSLDEWRQIIQRSNEVLTRDVGTFRRALRYGLVNLVDQPVVFYFEKVKKA
jgi:5-methylcytosine-specific restriction endonuclease McrA